MRNTSVLEPYWRHCGPGYCAVKAGLQNEQGSEDEPENTRGCKAGLGCGSGDASRADVFFPSLALPWAI